MALVATAGSGAQPVPAKNDTAPNQRDQKAAALAAGPSKPVVIVVEPSAQEVDAIAEQEAANSRIMGYPPDDWVALFTAVLGISTIFLWIATHKSAQAASRAAVIAERALVELEAPAIFVKIGRDYSDLPPAFGSALKGNIKLPGPWWWCFVNYGRTPAHLLSYATSLVWVPAGDKINPINLTVGDLPWGFVIPPDGTETAHIDIQPKAATSALAEQKAKETGLVNADASKLEGWLLYPLAIGIYSATYGLLAFASGTTAPKMNLSKAISEKVSIF